ncbi:hypothetical protein RN001_008772 [Aquatica leii]|uniref:Uncharacterized protein n=1 Tax=Aquatica leii TaxID=1421715 RepID=A0AAN7PHN8_9COLE|nr:hypothetical protein RN001_008772 [Aquatica leii]
MKCCSIKLANRLEEKPILQKDQLRCHPVLLENDNEFRSTSSSEDRSDHHGQVHVSVLNLILPKDTKAFNTGSSTQRWANKRPRLKSAKKVSPEELKDVDNLDVPNIIEELQFEYKLEEDTLVSRNEIDPDIQRLLEGTHVDEELDVNDNKKISFDDEVTSKKNHKLKRKHKKKSKEKRKDKEKKKMKKNVSFSLSKPPTPQTEQVIRVEVVSNYSVEFEAIESHRSDCKMPVEVPSSKIQTRRSNDQFLCELCFNEKLESPNLILESKKVVLFPRCGKHGEKVKEDSEGEESDTELQINEDELEVEDNVEEELVMLDKITVTNITERSNDKERDVDDGENSSEVHENERSSGQMFVSKHGHPKLNRIVLQGVDYSK